MNPVFYIRAEGDDITPSIQERLISLTITDQLGVENDVLTIEVDDRDWLVNLPPKGGRLEVAIGYEPKNGHVNPIDLVNKIGVFFLSETKTTGNADDGFALSITAKGVFDETPFKTIRRRSYHRMTIKEIVDQCAERSGMTAIVHPLARSVKIAHLEQESESDASFLDKQMGKLGFVVKPSDGVIYVAPTEQITKLIRDTVPPSFDIDITQIKEHSWLSQGRGNYSAVRAKYINRGPGLEDAGEYKSVLFPAEPGDGAIYEIVRVFPDKDSADSAAKTKKKLFDTSLDTLSFQSVGYPEFIAGCAFNLKNARPETPKSWIATKVTHSFDSNGGYDSDVECEQPESVKAMDGATGGTSS